VLGFPLASGGETATFTSFVDGYLNLIATPREARRTWWGRVIVQVDAVGALHARARTAALSPEASPRDAA
jgi:hypothetical protein